MRPDLTSLARTLLAALDAHKDATEGREIADGVHADAYHPDHADAVYEAKSALRSALNATPGEDPAPHVAGAPGASGGALGVGLRSTIFECRCCDQVSNGYNDGSVTEPGWHDILNIDGPNAICPDCVKDPTALDSLRADGYYDAHVGPARPVAGASGVGVLTNCDNCANDYMVNGRRQCREVDSLWANFRTEREAADELDGWVAENTDDNGTPLCGATGCPGWAKRGEG